AWHCNNAYTAQGFQVERSTDGTNFTTIATVAVTVTSFTDNKLGGGTYYYRVGSFNAFGTSRPSNVDSVFMGGGDHPTIIDHSAGFLNHGDLTANGTGRFTPAHVAVGTFVGENDIGNTATPGAASFDPASGTYTLQASGADIFGSTDAFHYVYEPLNGDGEITARLTSIDPSHSVSDFVKAGVMIRETLSAEAREVSMLDTRDHSFRFQRRFDPGGGTDRGPNSDYPDINNPRPPPLWLRLRRQGNVFTAFWAPDNAGMPGTWTQIDGPQTINMARNVVVGLALTAHNNSGVLAAATFDHVSITGATGPLAPTAARVTDGDFGEAGSIWTTSRVGIAKFTTSFTYQV